MWHLANTKALALWCHSKVFLLASIVHPPRVSQSVSMCSSMFVMFLNLNVFQNFSCKTRVLPLVWMMLAAPQQTIPPYRHSKWFLNDPWTGGSLATSDTQLGSPVARRDVTQVSAIGRNGPDFQPIRASLAAEQPHLSRYNYRGASDGGGGWSGPKIPVGRSTTRTQLWLDIG